MQAGWDWRVSGRKKKIKVMSIYKHDDVDNFVIGQYVDDVIIVTGLQS